MAFQRVIHRSGSGGSPTGRDVRNGLGYSYYARTPEEEKKAKHGTRVCFHIGLSILKEARFMVGDRLDLLHDRDAGLGLLRRISPDDEAGFKLSGSSGVNCAIIAFTPRPDEDSLFPKTRRVMILENVSVEDQGILFAWPKVNSQPSLPSLTLGKIQTGKGAAHGK